MDTSHCTHVNAADDVKYLQHTHTPAEILSAGGVATFQYKEEEEGEETSTLPCV